MAQSFQGISLPMESSAPLKIDTQEDACRSVSILGATGTIGCQTLDVLAHHPDRFSVNALTAHSNVERLAEQAIRFRAQCAVIGDEKKYGDLKALLSGSGVAVAAGENAIIEAAARPADCYMAAIVGVAGLKPTYEAAKQGSRIALANKECLVSAGTVFLDAVKSSDTTMIPVDSEHSAAFQLLAGAKKEDIFRLMLTASGGPFRTWPLEQLATATPAEALRHPTWDMGRKITIDSATLMNKGLELIEAFHLFPVGAEQLDVIVHPQSIIHCFAEFADGSTLAQMSPPDMRMAIAYALSWPGRMASLTRRLTIEDLASMTFEPPDEKRFPALRIARDVLNEAGTLGTVFNAANEVAVEAFLSGAIGFMSIAELVEETLNAAVKDPDVGMPQTIADIIAIDAAARRLAMSSVKPFA